MSIIKGNRKNQLTEYVVSLHKCIYLSQFEWCIPAPPITNDATNHLPLKCCITISMERAVKLCSWSKTFLQCCIVTRCKRLFSNAAFREATKQEIGLTYIYMYIKGIIKGCAAKSYEPTQERPNKAVYKGLFATGNLIHRPELPSICSPDPDVISVDSTMSNDKGRIMSYSNDKNTC